MIFNPKVLNNSSANRKDLCACYLEQAIDPAWRLHKAHKL